MIFIIVIIGDDSLNCLDLESFQMIDICVLCFYMVREKVGLLSKYFSDVNTVTWIGWKQLI